MFLQSTIEIILASASTGRKKMLEDAGLNFRVLPADVDEGSIIESLENDHMAPSDIAEILARTKAETVSARNVDAAVIGADQVLSLGTEIFRKARNKEEAGEALLKLRGRTHQLHSAVAVARGGETRWAHVGMAELHMRDFSAQYLGQYLGHAGDRILRSVGCYEIEGPGVHLFNEISGDSFTIRGLPLISLLNHLYDDGVL